jgi:hypothetical protein
MRMRAMKLRKAKKRTKKRRKMSGQMTVPN